MPALLLDLFRATNPALFEARVAEAEAAGASEAARSAAGFRTQASVRAPPRADLGAAGQLPAAVVAQHSSSGNGNGNGVAATAEQQQQQQPEPAGAIGR